MPWRINGNHSAVAVVPDNGSYKKFSINDPLITGHNGKI